MGLKTFDIDGIKVEINPLIFEDYRFVSLSAKSSKTNKLMEQAQDEESKNRLAATLGEYTVNLMEMVLGNNLEHVEEELAARNDGFVPVEEMAKFYEKLVTAAQEKK